METGIFNKLKVLLLAVILAGCSGDNTGQLTDNDPYLWLEDIHGEKALDWVRSQNKISEQIFSSKPLYNELKTRFLEIYNDREKIVYPDLVGNMVYNLWKDEKNERGLWRRMKKEDFINGKSVWEVVLDLDLLSAEENRKWVFDGADWLAPDNRICLLSLSDGGKDEAVKREFDASTGSFVAGGFHIKESKSTSAWVDENRILVATNYGPGTMTTSGYPRMVKLWKRGGGPENAEPILETDTAYMGVFLWGINSGGRQYAFMEVKKGFYETDLYLYDPKGIRKIEIPSDVQLYGMHKDELLLYLQSDWPVGGQSYGTGSIVSFSITSFLNGITSVRTIYQPDERSSFESLLSAKDFIIVSAMDNIQGRLMIFRSDGESWNADTVQVPGIGVVSLEAAQDQSNDYFFSFSNPVTPATLFHANGTDIKEIKRQKDYFNAEGLVVEQYEAASKDGTIIPYFIVHKDNMSFNGKNPTMIDGYGGFNSPELPYYSATVGAGWLEQGGVYVIANIRGGGEFGPSWHKAALKEKRQNAYDDFFAVAEDLVNRNITSPKHMGVYGWSNGGLLAGVALTQRPDLYSAIVVGAPLLDMKRYSKMLAGASWMDEYGDPDKPGEWAFISRYSPYHNIRKKGKYPEAFFITSTLDDRVHPGHARKMAAKMIDMGHPVIYHETIEGGHGASSTNAQTAEKWALIYTYMNMKLHYE